MTHRNPTLIEELTRLGVERLEELRHEATDLHVKGNDQHPWWRRILTVKTERRDYPDVAERTIEELDAMLDKVLVNVLTLPVSKGRSLSGTDLLQPAIAAHTHQEGS